jgi:hypothetical protein
VEDVGKDYQPTWRWVLPDTNQEIESYSVACDDDGATLVLADMAHTRGRPQLLSNRGPHAESPLVLEYPRNCGGLQVTTLKLKRKTNVSLRKKHWSTLRSWKKAVDRALATRCYDLGTVRVYKREKQK